MPLLICLFLMQKKFSFSSCEIFPATDNHCPPFLASLLIPYVKFLNKIEIVFYYLLTEYCWSLRSEEQLFQLKYFGQFRGMSNYIFITLKISNIDWITLSQSSVLIRSKSYPGVVSDRLHRSTRLKTLLILLLATCICKHFKYYKYFASCCEWVKCCFPG